MKQEKQKPLVLLVARSSNNLKLIGKHLHEYFEVQTADDAESAWAALLELRNITLIISELELAIDGFGLLERLRNAGDSWLAATPLLLLVGENDVDANRELAFQAGATDFINLPFVSSELTARARLHANLYVQQQGPLDEIQSVTAANLLQELSQQNYFNSRVRQELSFSLRHRSNVSLCKLKLDNVKAIVSEFDKATAVTAVKAVAQSVQRTLRREDALCYLGNAEFCLLYPATNGIGATTVIKRILGSLSGNKANIAGKKVPLSLSGAVYSCIANEHLDIENVFARLDKGLAQARAKGGGQVVSSPIASPDQVFSVDRALKSIEAGETDDLSRQAAPLLETVLPLLEYVDEELQLGLRAVNQKLREKLKAKSKSSPQ